MPSAVRSAFTLIEILVVVAIIALLVAILLPSLSRAREQAKIMTCKANAKQIGTVTGEYQVEYRDFLPVMFNDAATDGNTTTATKYPMRTVLPSVALRAYDGGTRKSVVRGTTYDPELHWSNSVINTYQSKIMPAHFSCPFQRGQGPDTTVTVRNDAQYFLQEETGQFESYRAWRRDSGRDHPNTTPPWQGGAPEDATQKYGNFSWNIETRTGFTNVAGDKNRHRQWTVSDARRLDMLWDTTTKQWVKSFDSASPSLSDVTVLYCAQGEYMIQYRHPPVSRCNMGSHRSSAGGGTNAVFADTHVEWVKGTRIGSP